MPRHIKQFRWQGFGRKKKNRINLAKAFVAKSVYKFGTTNILIEYLRNYKKEGFADGNSYAKYHPEQHSPEPLQSLQRTVCTLGFQYKYEAMRFQEELKSRLKKFNLVVNTEKTLLIEFGRYAAERRKEKGKGKGKPETFDFLGFTHICSKSRMGKFTVLRKTSAKKIRNKLAELKETMRERLHWSIPEIGKWLKSVIIGHSRYYGVPWNGKSLTDFRSEIVRRWCKVLCRRSQKHRITWERMNRLAKKWPPNPFICHPYPLEQHARQNLKQEPSALVVHAGICAVGAE